MNLIDGKKVAAEIKQEIAEEVKKLIDNGGKQPHLAAILVGHDGGSETYVAYKIKDCEAVGFKSSLIRYEDDVTEEELLAKVEELNNDDDLDGFIVQLPLPKTCLIYQAQGTTLMEQYHCWVKIYFLSNARFYMNSHALQCSVMTHR